MEPEPGENGGSPEGGFSNVVNILSNMFGQMMDNAAIYAVVESCDGDLQHSIDALMHIIKDSEETSNQSETQEVPEFNPLLTTSNYETVAPDTNNMMPDSTEQLHTRNSPNTPDVGAVQSQPSVNYASASRNIGVVPKKRNLPSTSPREQSYRPSEGHFDKKWTDQLKRIIELHYKGYRTLVIMRGPPGCGKSFLSRKIVDATVGGNEHNYMKHIQSTDDFFMVRGKYVYVKERLSEAHAWNQNRVLKSLRSGLSPVIIDNTNIEIWEMQPYAKAGVMEGYYIEVIDPISAWAKNIYQLFKRNSHHVPFANVKKMANNFQPGVSAQVLIRDLDLYYPLGTTTSSKVPPVMRQLPAYVEEKFPTIYYRKCDRKGNLESTKTVTSQNPNNIVIASGTTEMHVCKNPQPELPIVPTESTASAMPQGLEQLSTMHSDIKQVSATETMPIVSSTSELNSAGATNLMAQVLQKYNDVEKKLQEFDELELNWEMGESWEAPGPSNARQLPLNPTASAFQPSLNPFDVPLSSMELQPCSPGPSRDPKTPRRVPEQLLPEASGWVDWQDITRFMPDWTPTLPSTSQAPKKLAAEKESSSTCMEFGDAEWVNSKYKVVTATPKDINFYYMPREEKIPDTRMWDKSSMTNDEPMVENYRCKNEEKHFEAFRKMFKNIARPELRDIFDKCCGDVNWAVEIVLDGVASNSFEPIEEENESDTEDLTQDQCDCLAVYNVIPNISTQNVEKNNETAEQAETTLIQKKSKKEKGVSESLQQLKKQIEQNVAFGDNHYSQHCLKIRKMRRGESNDGAASNIPSTSNPEYSPTTSKEGIVAPQDASDDDESDSGQDFKEQTITVNLGSEFVMRLDETFNRQDVVYPSNIVPFVNMPLSTLNELNALWIESLTHQIESQAAYSEILMKEDEEFARKLAEKEAEMQQAGREPEIPDFKEIMDMDIAQSLYEKDVSEWRNKEPTDMAAKMSREKLYNLFPEFSQDVLSELLMAHDNNFKATVETLLVSTGQSTILEEKNGVNKFVMKKEMARQEKILEEEKRALSDEEWPVISKIEKVDMKVVEGYRREAQRHLDERNILHQKAHKYIQRGMTQYASYASEVAAFHKKKFEQANSRAATSLIQINSANRGEDHLDLHFLFVDESLTAVDLFLDHHITRLREDPGRKRSKTLFIITGRGLHSSGGARIKPAVRKHLKKRGLSIGLKNPGLVTTEVRPECLLTHERET